MYKVYEINVKPYMTKDDSPFNIKFNNSNPMPFRRMEGFIRKETKGMVWLRCRGQIFELATETCMCCGRPITNPISRYFGLGPICGNHNYVNPFSTREELIDAVNKYRKTLNEIIWEGWVPKSAILSKKEIIL